MNWHLRYAPHVGYRPPFDPMFRALVGSDDPVDHVAFAAEQGFAGVLCAAARRWSASEQTRVGQALTRHGLEAGCVLYTGFDQLKNTSWATDSEDAWRWIAAELEQATATAQRVGARQIAVLGGAHADQAIAPQHEAFVRHLRRAADQVARDGLALCLETLNAHTVPGMLLHHLPDALQLLRSVDHPAVRLIFDTAHVRAMDGDVPAQLDAAWEYVEIVQLADSPGRQEPGSGQVDFAGVLQMLARRGYRGLVELEHGWAQPGADCEQRGLETLHRLDAAAASALKGTAP